jgi:hypothetical protein
MAGDGARPKFPRPPLARDSRKTDGARMGDRKISHALDGHGDREYDREG